MKKNPSSQSGLFNPRVFVAFTVCSIGALLAMVSFAAPRPRPAPPTLGHPIISGIGGRGCQEGLRGHSPHADRLDTSGAGWPYCDTRWSSHSLRGGILVECAVGAPALGW